MSFLNNLFSITNEYEHKVIRILGFKFKLINNVSLIKNSKKDLLRGVQRLLTISTLHQKTFNEYKNKYQGKSIVLIGAGPSLNFFNPIKNAVYVGCNRAFLFDKVNFDYLFSIDKLGIENYYEEFKNYEKNNCVKFIGDQNLGKNFQIPESYILKLKNVKRYKTSIGLYPSRFTLDIESEPLGNFASVSLQAIQFILYTNPAKVYLVGIDCTTGSQGHFTGKTPDSSGRGENAKVLDENNINSYKALKEFAQMYYPETEIISINPVGLKGIFKDEYTQEFLEQYGG